MKSSPPFLLAASFALLAAGCIDSETAYHLNPDGSGKLHHRVKLTNGLASWADDEPAKAFSQSIIRGASGIEAWDEVHFRMTDAGKAVEFRGTGYFPDLDRVSLRLLRDAKGQQLVFPIPVWAREPQPDGSQRLTAGDGPEFDVEVRAETTDLDPKSMAQSIGDTFWTAMVLGSSVRTTLHYGAPIEGGTMSIQPDGSATIHYSGPDLAEKLKSKSADPDVALLEGLWNQPSIRQLALGRAEPVQATLPDGASPLFDYAAEAASAELPLSPEMQGGWTKLESLD